MPIAKLSREFYDRFGEKATEELLVLLNSVERSHPNSELAKRLDEMDTRVASIERRLDSLDHG